MSDLRSPVKPTTITKRQAYALEKTDFMRYLQEADFSDARRYFELARLTTRQHDKGELMAGAVVGILVAVLMGGGSWFATLITGLAAFAVTLILIFLIHWLRAPSAFHRLAQAELQTARLLHDHKLIPHVLRKESQVNWTLFSPWQCPRIRASIAIKFENIASHDLALKEITLRLYERLNTKTIKEIPLRGRNPQTVRQKPQILYDFHNPVDETDIAGLKTKAGDFSQKYFFIDDEMLVADLPNDTLINDKHFLRLTVEAVGQRSYHFDVEVDWKQPGLWPLSINPVIGDERVIKGQEIGIPEIDQQGKG